MKISHKKVIKNVLFILLWIFIILEIINIVTDIYNFNQVKKIKSIVNTINLDEYNFTSLNTFNDSLDQNIKPIRNCYYVNNNFKPTRNSYYVNKDTSKDSFVFWFKIYSFIYKIIYSSEYSVYPEGNEPKKLDCSSLCYDIIDPIFIQTISNPCLD